jgi:hypothetical protein
LLARPLTNGAALPITTNFGGASYLRFGVGASLFGRLTTTVGGGAPPPAFAMTIVRTK